MCRAVFALCGSHLGSDDVGQMQEQWRACSVSVLEHGRSQAQGSPLVVSRAPVNTRGATGSRKSGERDARLERVSPCAGDVFLGSVVN